VRLPQVEQVLQRAQELDRFCADVDQMIGINLLAGGDRKLFGTEVAGAAETPGDEPAVGRHVSPWPMSWCDPVQFECLRRHSFPTPYP